VSHLQSQQRQGGLWVKVSLRHIAKGCLKKKGKTCNHRIFVLVCNRENHWLFTLGKQKKKEEYFLVLSPTILVSWYFLPFEFYIIKSSCDWVLIFIISHNPYHLRKVNTEPWNLLEVAASPNAGTFQAAGCTNDSTGLASASILDLGEPRGHPSSKLPMDWLQLSATPLLFISCLSLILLP
jgi:hypothetical protein